MDILICKVLNGVTDDFKGVSGLRINVTPVVNPHLDCRILWLESGERNTRGPTHHKPIPAALFIDHRALFF